MHSGVRYEIKVHVVSHGKASTSGERTIIPREFLTYKLTLKLQRTCLCTILDLIYNFD